MPLGTVAKEKLPEESEVVDKDLCVGKVSEQGEREETHTQRERESEGEEVDGDTAQLAGRVEGQLHATQASTRGKGHEASHRKARQFKVQVLVALAGTRAVQDDPLKRQREREREREKEKGEGWSERKEGHNE